MIFDPEQIKSYQNKLRENNRKLCNTTDKPNQKCPFCNKPFYLSPTQNNCSCPHCYKYLVVMSGKKS